MNLREEAKQLDCVQKEAKHGLFKLKGFDQDAWLDIREESVKTYSYSTDGEPKNIEEPTEVKQLRRKFENQDSKSLSEFA
jgi:coenzyme F420-reducing hydrogenase alpha subunit